MADYTELESLYSDEELGELAGKKLIKLFNDGFDGEAHMALQFLGLKADWDPDYNGWSVQVKNDND